MKIRKLKKLVYKGTFVSLVTGVLIYAPFATIINSPQTNYISKNLLSIKSDEALPVPEQILNVNKTISNKSEVSSDGQYVMQLSDGYGANGGNGVPVMQIVDNNGFTGDSSINLKIPSKGFKHIETWEPDLINRVVKGGNTWVETGLKLNEGQKNPTEIYNNAAYAGSYNPSDVISRIHPLNYFRLLPDGNALGNATKNNINIATNLAYRSNDNYSVKPWKVGNVNNLNFSFDKNGVKPTNGSFLETTLFKSSFPVDPVYITNIIPLDDGVMYFTGQIEKDDYGLTNEKTPNNPASGARSADQYYFFMPYNSTSLITPNDSLTQLQNWPGQNNFNYTIIDSVGDNNNLYLLLLDSSTNQSYLAKAKVDGNHKLTISKITKNLTSIEGSMSGIPSSLYLSNGNLFISNSNGSYVEYDLNLKKLNSSKMIFNNKIDAIDGYNSISQILPMGVPNSSGVITKGEGQYAISLNSESPYIYYIPETNNASPIKVLDLNATDNLNLSGSYDNFSKMSDYERAKTKVVTSINFIRNDGLNDYLQINTGYTDPNGNVLGWIASIDHKDPSKLQILGTTSNFIGKGAYESTSDSLYTKSKQLISNLDYSYTKNMKASLDKMKKNGDVTANEFRETYKFVDSDYDITNYFNNLNSFVTTNGLSPDQIKEHYFYINLWTGKQVLAQVNDVSFGDPIDGSGTQTTLPINLSINITSKYGDGVPSVTEISNKITTFDQFTPIEINTQASMMPYIIGASIASGAIIIIIVASFLMWRHKKIRNNFKYLKQKRETRFDERNKDKNSKRKMHKEAKRMYKHSLDSATSVETMSEDDSSKGFFATKHASKPSKDKVSIYLKDLSSDPYQEKFNKSKAMKKASKKIKPSNSSKKFNNTPKKKSSSAKMKGK